MADALQAAKGFEDLLRGAPAGGRYAYDSIFDASTWRSRRLAKKKFKLLRGIDAKLGELLEEGEAVRFVTWGIPVNFWESYFLGWIVYYLNRRALVLTDRRILMIQIDSKNRPKQLLSQIRYGAIDHVDKSFFHGTVLRLRSGRSRAFSGMPKADRLFLTELVSRVKSLVSGDPTARAIEDLCPHCRAVAQIGSPACTACDGAFKRPKRAGALSLLFPGLGDIYLGHWKLAIFEILFVAFIWFAALLPDPEFPLTALGYVILAAILVLFLHVPDALATWYVARMGVYPHE